MAAMFYYLCFYFYPHSVAIYAATRYRGYRVIMAMPLTASIWRRARLDQSEASSCCSCRFMSLSFSFPWLNAPDLASCYYGYFCCAVYSQAWRYPAWQVAFLRMDRGWFRFRQRRYQHSVLLWRPRLPSLDLLGWGWTGVGRRRC